MKKTNKVTRPSEPSRPARSPTAQTAGARKFCCALEKVGQLGTIAAELFRVQKASARAKVYSGGITGRYGNVSFRPWLTNGKGYAFQFCASCSGRRLRFDLGMGIRQ